MCKKYGLLIVLFFLSFSRIISQDLSTELSYQDQLVEKAKKMKLSERRYWRILLHYIEEPFYKGSHIDDPAFFLAEDGKVNPASELEATIRAFFQEPAAGKPHPAFRFIARYEWLRQKLNFNIEKMPYNPMPEFEKIYNEIDPVRLYIMFPSGYIESPASMFGHTFLLLESRNKPWHKATSVNYAAVTDETNGPVFAFKGLTGLYKGYFSYLPYHKKIKEYNDIDSRDLWEYKFNYTEDEIRKMMYHMVELEGVYSNYYFLDENCSYNLLFLLEAGRPKVELVNKFIFACEPIDTLREIINQDTIESVHYRPSKLKKIHHYADKLGDEQVDYAIRLGRGKENISEERLNALAETDREKALVLDLAAEYSQYLLAKDYITLDTYRNSFFSIIRKRSTIDYSTNETYDVQRPNQPDKSHFSKKAGVGLGLENEQIYTELQFRFTSHNLMDDETGLNKNSQLIFGNAFGRYFPQKNEFLLQRFDIVDLDSLSSSTKFGIRTGMLLKSGFVRDIVNKNTDDQQLTYYLNAGPNIVFEIPLSYVYTSLQYYQSHSTEYDYYTTTEFGGRLGLIHEYGIWKSRIETQCFHWKN